MSNLVDPSRLNNAQQIFETKQKRVEPHFSHSLTKSISYKNLYKLKLSFCSCIKKLESLLKKQILITKNQILIKLLNLLNIDPEFNNQILFLTYGCCISIKTFNCPLNLEDNMPLQLT